MKSCLTLLVLSLLLLAGQANAQNLVVNGDFEAGLTGWQTWAAPPPPATFWDAAWIQSNDCDIWVPTNGCPYEGTTSHAQKKGSGAGNAHGGIFQVLNVEPGRSYTVSGFWSGGVTGNLDGNNGTWWEVVVYDGTVDATVIDAGVGAQDTLIAKKEKSALGNGEVFQFQWETFGGSFQPQSNTVTLALKVGSYYTAEAAGYHDLVSVTLDPVALTAAAPVPVNQGWMLVLLILTISSLAYLYLPRRL